MQWKCSSCGGRIQTRYLGWVIPNCKEFLEVLIIFRRMVYFPALMFHLNIKWYIVMKGKTFFRWNNSLVLQWSTQRISEWLNIPQLQYGGHYFLMDCIFIMSRKFHTSSLVTMPRPLSDSWWPCQNHSDHWQNCSGSLTITTT